MGKFKVTVCRIAYAYHDIEVEADSIDMARDVAWNESGNHSYNEKHVEYEANEVEEIKKFFNGDLQRDVESHLQADEISLNKDADDEVWYLDINDTGYFYDNKNERDFDFELAKQLFIKD